MESQPTVTQDMGQSITPPPVLALGWADVLSLAQDLVRRRLQEHGEGVYRIIPEGTVAHAIYGIPTGGSVVACLVSGLTGLPLVDGLVPGCLVVDDLVDSGATLKPFTGRVGVACDALLKKAHAPKELAVGATIVRSQWVRFPWENESGPTDAVVRLIQSVGEDPKREGLRETPARVCKALQEMTEGYREDPKAILSKTFEHSTDEIVCVRGIRFTSVCEHHLLPFVGTATVAYLPGPRIVGLSKLARLVLCYAKRLQIQERLTQDIASAIMQHLDAHGAAVVVRAQHLCMGCRGVKQPDAEMVTSAMLGRFRESPASRAEVLALMGSAR